MSYELFKDYIVQNLQQKLQDVEIKVNKVRKNNGIELDSLAIHEADFVITPCIYLNQYYMQFQQGLSVQNITNEICSRYKELKKNCECKKNDNYADYLRDFTAASEHIIFKLVNFEKNKKLLEDVPFTRFLDLAIVYYVVCKIEKEEVGTILVKNSFFEEWDCSLEELHEKAVENTMRIFPARVRSMEEVIFGMMGREEEVIDYNDRSQRMYVVSNSMNLQGAAVILYPNLLRNFFHGLKRKAKGLVILPSSIHEQILIPYTEHMEVDSLRAMVREINSTQVAEEEILSDSVYVYSAKDDKVFLADL